MKTIHFKGVLFIFLIIILHTACEKGVQTEISYESDMLRIEKLTPNAYIHISYLDTKEYGKVPCNGMVFIDQGEALVFDTPTNNTVSEELINWIKQDLKARVKTVVVSHFHSDALGGLEAFHEKGIASYGYKKTIEIVQKNGDEVPQYTIDPAFEHYVGDKKVVSMFVGEGHTSDIIVGYFPHDKLLYGGCLVKELTAGRGNVKDANIEAWPETIEKLKVLVPQAEIVVPGHGKPGGRDLLDYTYKLFQNR